MTMLSSNSEVDDILSQFPGPAKLCPSRAKWLLILLLSAFFVFGGYLGVSKGDPLGWLPLIFFGLGIVVAAVQLLPGASWLMLDGEGFEVKTLFRRHRSHWPDVSDFRAVSTPPSVTKRVAYFDKRFRNSKLGKLNIALVGGNAMLADRYGLAASDLAQLMASWRALALARRPAA